MYLLLNQPFTYFQRHQVSTLAHDQGAELYTISYLNSLFTVYKQTKLWQGRESLLTSC